MALERQNLQDSFSPLPPELIALIYFYLIPTDIESLVFVSRYICTAILSDSVLWKNKLELHFPHCRGDSFPDAKATHRFFARQYKKQDYTVDKSRLLLSAKEGDLFTLDKMSKEKSAPSILPRDWSPLCYARKYKKQLWLDRFFKLFPEDYKYIAQAAIHTLQPVQLIKTIMDKELNEITIINLAIDCGHLEYLKSFDIIIYSQFSKTTLITKAIQSANLELVDFFLQKFKHEISNENAYDLLIEAIHLNEMSLIKLIMDQLRESFDDQSKDIILAKIASIKISIEIINFFLDKAVNHHLTLLTAAHVQNIRFIRAYLKRHPAAFTVREDDTNNTLLHHYFRRQIGDDEMDNLQELLLLCPGLINEPNKIGRTPLMDAFCHSSSPSIIKCLLKSGADLPLDIIDLINYNRYRKDKVYEILQLFIEKGFNIEERFRKYNNKTLLELSMTRTFQFYTNFPLAKALIKHGAKIEGLLADNDFKVFFIHPEKEVRDLFNFYIDHRIHDEAKQNVLKLITQYVSITVLEPHYSYRQLHFSLSAAYALLVSLFEDNLSPSLFTTYDNAFNKGQLGKLFHSPAIQNYIQAMQNEPRRKHS